ncbi:MAG TPA: nucleoside hydrolase [Pseudonocardia sp.]|uniref:nucleoside hydrolase n=1 Tax=Pseudonocardia sp. TaxID=60912 RepID=UPI002B9CDACA|nr:nucleoside hydrolase [Pseudonocardia sp.]HTF52104.1 nucleoside hydrolase [Pseudonocardia sp.]
MTSRATARPDPIPVVLDCDPGVDDAVALLLAFRSAELRVRAVTTVAGNAGIEVVTANAAAVLDLAGAPPDLPLAAGAAGPLRGGERVPDEPIHGGNALGDVTLPVSARLPAAQPAVELIAQLALEHPGELVLIALGPLTNVARLVTEQPAAAAALREIVHMGGAAFAQGNITPAAEFNTFCDPEAARIVLTSGLPIRLVPLDVTRRTGFPRALSARLASSANPAAAAAGAMLLGMTAAHQARTGAAVCHVHDASAVASVLAPEAMTWQRAAVEVECAGELSRGALVVDALGRTDWPATVDIALSAREGVLEELLMSRLERRP